MVASITYNVTTHCYCQWLHYAFMTTPCTYQSCALQRAAPLRATKGLPHCHSGTVMPFISYQSATKFAYNHFTVTSVTAVAHESPAHQQSVEL